MSSLSLQRNAELRSVEQAYGNDPLADRAADLSRREFVAGFVEKWDELIDWDARAKRTSQTSSSTLPRCRRRLIFNSVTVVIPYFIRDMGRWRGRCPRLEIARRTKA
jgi:hypothetical protein